MAVTIIIFITFTLVVLTLSYSLLGWGFKASFKKDRVFISEHGGKTHSS